MEEGSKASSQEKGSQPEGQRPDASGQDTCESVNDDDASNSLITVRLSC